MTTNKLIKALQRLKVETGSIACMSIMTAIRCFLSHYQILSS